MNNAAAIILCITQLALGFFGSGALASNTVPSSPPGASAEFTLLENIAALQGENLPGPALETRLNTLFGGYTLAMNPTGQSARLRQALVDLGVDTPAQADRVVTQLGQRAKLAVSSGENLEMALGELLASAPEGAQFSGCALGGGILIGASAFVLLLGYAVGGIDESEGHEPNGPLLLGGGGMAAGIALIVAGAEGGC